MPSPPTQPSVFPYQPLNHNEIRLIKLLSGDPDDPIEVEMFTVSLDEHVRYNALSYTWGSQDNLRIILVDGRPLQVGAELEEALKAARRAIPRKPIDWKWQREEISPANFGITDENVHPEFRLWRAIQCYNDSTRTVWDPSNNPSIDDEGKKKLLDDFQTLDDEMKEKFQSWWQLYLLLVLVTGQAVLEDSFKGLGEGCACSGASEDLLSKFTARQKHYIQAAVEQEEFLRKGIAGKESGEFSMRFLHERLRGFLDKFAIELPQNIWVDALCINQLDIVERNIEVPRMGLIYSRSAKVIVWLGLQEDDSQTAIDFFIAANTERKSGRSSDDPLSFLKPRLDRKTLNTIVAFFIRPWFSRVWIIQEYVVSKRSGPRFMCGEARFESGGIAWVAMAINSEVVLPQAENLKKLQLFNTIRTHLNQPIFGSRIAYLNTDIAHRIRRRLLPWLIKYRNSDSTDPRDKVFAFLGLINQDGCEHYADMTTSSRKDQKMCNDCLKIPLDYMPNSFKVDYRQPVVDVYACLVRSSLQASRKLNILTACHDRSNLVNRTWVPDWTTDTSEDAWRLLSLTCFLPQGLNYRFGPRRSIRNVHVCKERPQVEVPVYPDSTTEDTKDPAPEVFRASGDYDSIAEITEDLRFLKAKGIIWAEVHWVMPLPEGKMSYGSHDDNKWSTPVANLEFLNNTNLFFRIYHKSPLLVRHVLRMKETDAEDNKEFIQMFSEWEEFMRKWSDFMKAFSERLKIIQSQMKFPTREFQGFNISWNKNGETIENLKDEMKEVATAEAVSNSGKEFDETKELELKEQESSVLRQFVQDFEQIALEAASKKLFSFFWRMQSSRRRFLLGKVVADSAKLRADMCKCEECLGGYISFGQGRSDTKNGDMVCVLLGCDIPMLIRKDTESGLYDLIGPCYWLGVMHGEAMTALENKEVEFEEFVFR